ncbi:hypothetical protein HYR53_10665 [Candidatus Acetothermia bacterium]|nr:hypothetical protein [Candidatus Acetothermia bacterium]
MFWAVLILFINFGISWFNAWGVGRGWVEAKMEGGWPLIVAVSGAVMSAVGFTWCYLIIAAAVAASAKLLIADEIEYLLSYGYLIIIFPLIGSGLVLTLQSWLSFWRNKNLATGFAATWNTFSSYYNLHRAISILPGIFSKLSSSSKRGRGNALILLLLIFALIGGTLTTIAIIRHKARSEAERISTEMEERMRAEQKGSQQPNPAT